MNKARYVYLNGDKVIGIVYESDKFGRTIVFTDEIDLNFSVEIYDVSTSEKIKNVEIIEFLSEMIPNI